MNPIDHVAIIMDGNGRWGLKYKKSRNAGHKAGLITVEKIIKETIKNNIKFITLYAFSTENWKRPKKEINYLFNLLENFLVNKIEDLHKQNISLGIVVAYGQILKKDILEIPKYGWINIHYSLLPKLRGAAPIQRAIMENETSTGISIMKINEGLDSGPICNQYSVNILENENSEDLSQRLSNLASEKILQNIDDIFDNKAHFKEQDHSKSTYAKKIKKEEGKINWEDSNLKIIGKINGLYPNPGGWFEFKGERYKILKAEKSILSGKSGYVLSDNFEIGCGENSIKIIEIQRQGKTVQKTKEFLRGSQITKGTDLN